MQNHTRNPGLHLTDTHIQVLSLALSFLIHNKKKQSKSHSHITLANFSSIKLVFIFKLGVPVPRTSQCLRDMQIPQLQFLLFHHTDIQNQVLYLTLPLSFHDKPFLKTLTFSLSLSIFLKTVTLRIILNIDVVPVVSRSHTHPSHSQTSRLLTSSLSLGVLVPLGTQCIRDVQIHQFYLLVFHHTDTHM